MVMSQQAKKVLDNLRSDPKVNIYKIIKGKKGFDLAKKMLFVDPSEWSDPQESRKWALMWSESQKKNAIFVIFGKTPRKKTKIGIKLIIGSGPNFSTVGELRSEKDAFKRWYKFIHKV
jgi:hypothetical protein